MKEVICWDSGYLKSYVDQIKSYCREDVLFQSMSSMSTEVTQTVCFGDRRLPMGREICYEFYNLENTKILKPHQLEVGGEYIMIISNQHGLVRYDTNDIFYVKGMFFGVPDIIFKKRYGINFDFAGEKLTADQVQ